MAEFDEVYVATDTEEIKGVAEGFGAKVIMTSSDCETATERLYEVAQKVEADLYVMDNGDEPLVMAKDIVKCIPAQIPADGFFVSNLMTDYENPVEMADPTNLKIVTNQDISRINEVEFVITVDPIDGTENFVSGLKEWGWVFLFIGEGSIISQ